MPVAPPRVEPAEALRLARRAARFDARSVLRLESAMDRIRNCGTPIGAYMGFAVAGTAESRRAGLKGLETCGSTWACPVCSHKIAVRRAEEVTAAVAEAHRRGWVVVMLTLTMRHRAGQSLLELWDGVGYAWGKVTSGRGWITDKTSYGVQGWCRVVEVTHGKHGWHVHIHSLLFLDYIGDNRPTDVGAPLFQRWRNALVRKGFDAPLARSGGLDVRLVRNGDSAVLGDYFTKNTYQLDGNRIGHEVAGGSQKDGRNGNRTPFAILRDVVKNGEARDLALWHEWEKASHGRRQMTWSTGFRAQLVKVVELTDQEIADEDLGGEVVALMTRGFYLKAERYGLIPHLLTALEADDTLHRFAQVMADHGLAWDHPKE